MDNNNTHYKVHIDGDYIVMYKRIGLNKEGNMQLLMQAFRKGVNINELFIRQNDNASGVICLTHGLNDSCDVEIIQGYINTYKAECIDWLEVTT